MTNLRLGLAFLTLRLPQTPEGCVLEIIEAEHDNGKFWCIALRIQEADAVNQAYAYAAEDLLLRFGMAVDWKRLS